MYGVEELGQLGRSLSEYGYVITQLIKDEELYRLALYEIATKFNDGLLDGNKLSKTTHAAINRAAGE